MFYGWWLRDIRRFVFSKRIYMLSLSTDQLHSFLTFCKAIQHGDDAIAWETGASQVSLPSSRYECRQKIKVNKKAAICVFYIYVYICRIGASAWQKRFVKVQNFAELFHLMRIEGSPDGSGFVKKEKRMNASQCLEEVYSFFFQLLWRGCGFNHELVHGFLIYPRGKIWIHFSRQWMWDGWLEKNKNERK